MSYAKSTHLENISPWYISCQQLKPTFLTTYLIVVIQSSRYSIFYNKDISIDSVFYGGVTSINILILKPPLKIIGAIPLKPQVSSIVGTHI